MGLGAYANPAYRMLCPERDSRIPRPSVRPLLRARRSLFRHGGKGPGVLVPGYGGQQCP